uniref:Nuclear receptor domain-containing protein n=1 Tax=Panagrellus redivivus TaxID=6233 RepID=A0A7E4UX90_PANRE
MHEHNDSLAYTSEIEVLPDLMPESNQSCCVICGGKATCRHFGAFSCNACAAFFRRSVANAKSYTCLHHGNCIIAFRLVRRICAACRLKKCISVGMQECEVLSLGITPEKPENQQNRTTRHRISTIPENTIDSALLPKLQKFDHSSNFSVYQNNEWLRQIVLAKQSIKHQRLRMLPPKQSSFYITCVLPDIYEQLNNESRLCKMYLINTGIMDLVQDIVEKNITELIFRWNYFIIVLNTVKRDSIRERKISLVNYSVVEMSEASIKAYYATDPRFHKHLGIIAKTGAELWFRIEKLAKEIYAIGMTPEEHAFFLLLGMIEAITRQTSDPKMTKMRFKPLLDSVFRSMHIYYRDNFATNCTAERMGQLIMTLPLMNEIYNIANDHLVIKSICINNLEVVDTVSLQKAFRSEFNST